MVNNRTPEFCDPAFIEENQQTLSQLRRAVAEDRFGQLAISHINASSPGVELPEKEGVGLARKIGMDRALALFHQVDNPNGIIISLDADTLVQPNYCESVFSFFRSAQHPWAAVIEYEHRLSNDFARDEGIILYELFLRYHVLGLRYAGSPYAFHSIGSALACTAEAYAAVSGMCRKQAGEDFYFLQQLAKTGAVGHIRSTRVYPSSRASERVPFGTGRRISQHQENPAKYWMAYPFSVYEIIRQFTAVINSIRLDSIADLMMQARNMDEELYTFLSQQELDKVIHNMALHAKTNEQLRKLLHQWFDGFMIIRLIHYLRNHRLGEQPLIESLHQLIQQAKYPVPQSDDPTQLLLALRQLK